MVEKLYSEYDANITIRSSQGKTFKEEAFPYEKLKEISAVTFASKAVEEIVVVKHETKKANARMIGIEPSFLKITDMEHHMVDGVPVLNENGTNLGIIGAGLLDKLEGYIPDLQYDYERVEVYFPKRDARPAALSEPFRSRIIPLSGRFNYNKEVNQEALVLPLRFAQEMLGYEHEVSAIYLNTDKKSNIEKSKKVLQEKLGKDWIVKTQYEKNELIYKTSKSERLIVICILIFVFIMAAFNLVASLTMLFLEKKDDIRTMRSFGAGESFIFRIFFYEGLLISGKGVLAGLLTGYAVCAVQIFGAVLKMPNSGGEGFPVNLTWSDGILVVLLVGILSLLASYLPVKYLVARHR